MRVVMFHPAEMAISIHAPLAGRDHVRGVVMTSRPVFQSTRPSRGATRPIEVSLILALIFQSTRPSRGATDGVEEEVKEDEISIHAPLAGRDWCSGSRRW